MDVPFRNESPVANTAIGQKHPLQNFLLEGMAPDLGFVDFDS
jgi:hypothetical protein